MRKAEEEKRRAKEMVDLRRSEVPEPISEVEEKNETKIDWTALEAHWAKEYEKVRKKLFTENSKGTIRSDVLEIEVSRVGRGDVGASPGMIKLLM